MPQMPTITVQLVHIQGPFKGQVFESSDFPIHIGRHASCQIRFDKELTTISRHHARIEYKGNRFRIIDVSTNGTFINGKRVADVYLRDGDIISFSENGPKASFLTKIGAGSSAISASSSANNGKHPSASSSESMLTVGADQEVEVFSINAPLTIEFGQIRQSYTILPITIGSDPTCDFVIEGKNLSDRHVQIFFNEKNYYARDLTSKNLVTVNGRAIEKQSVLAQGAELSLTNDGPRFRFITGGRLAEIEDVIAIAENETKGNSYVHRSEETKSLLKNATKSLFRKLLK